MNRENNTWGFGGGFTSICDKLFDTMILGFLWVICSLPLVTIGASSTALYYALVKSVRKSDGYAVKEFFRAFKRDFVKATILWVITVVLTFILHLNMGILMSETSGYAGLFFICLYGILSVFILIMACYMFAALSRYEMGTLWFLKIGIYMTVRYFITSLAILAVWVSFGAIVWKVPMLIFFAPGAVAFVLSEFLEHVLKKHEPAAEQE